MAPPMPPVALLLSMPAPLLVPPAPEDPGENTVVVDQANAAVLLVALVRRIPGPETYGMLTFKALL